MTFDMGTWWLIAGLITLALGIIEYLIGRSVFAQLDKHGADIKEVRESYTTRERHDDDLDKIRKMHETDMERLRGEVKEVRNEMRTEIRSMSEDVKEIKENCIRREEFLQSQLKLESKMDKLMEFLMQGGK